jgi:hypothetical protein
MKRSVLNSRSAGSENCRDGIILAAESLAWLSGWLLIPAWLAVRGSDITIFLSFAPVAGLLLATGVAADRGRSFNDLDHFLWLVRMTCLAILLVGGAVFGLASLLISLVSA